MTNLKKIAFAICLIVSHQAIANDPCAPRITPEGYDYSLPCSMGELPSPELEPRVYFASNDTGLTAEARANLDAKIELINRHPQIAFNLTGYADTTEAPKPKDRASLGLARAKSVEAYMIANGIEPSRLAATGASHVMMIPKSGNPSSLAQMRFVTVIVATP